MQASRQEAQTLPYQHQETAHAAWHAGYFKHALAFVYRVYAGPPPSCPLQLQPDLRRAAMDTFGVHGCAWRPLLHRATHPFGAFGAHVLQHLRFDLAQVAHLHLLSNAARYRFFASSTATAGHSGARCRYCSPHRARLQRLHCSQ